LATVVAVVLQCCQVVIVPLVLAAALNAPPDAAQPEAMYTSLAGKSQ